MSYGTFQTVCLTTLGCIIAAFAVLRVRARCRERAEAADRMTGIAPPGHPDLDVILSDEDRDELLGIAAATEGTGLEIFESTEGETT